MNKEDVNSLLTTADLISGYLSQTLNELELKRFSDWLEEAPENYDLFKRLSAEQNLNSAYQTFKKYDVDKALAQVKQNTQTTGPKQIKLPGLWKLIAIAASVLLIFNLGTWFYSRNSDHSTKYDHIVAGSNQAILTMPNGKRIPLNNGKTGVVIDMNALSYTDGSLISVHGKLAAAQHEYLTAETPRGGTYQVVLSDGSKVWLNAASRIRFKPTFLGAASREVELSGEAYFEVFKDAKHPFVVKTAKQEITVLGTHFNINSYADETADKTTLLEGSVRARVLKPEAMPGSTVILKPGQQFKSDQLGKTEVLNVDVQTEVAWKNGDFVFEDEAMGSVMRKLSRWYNVDVSYQGEVSTERFNGKISRSKNIGQVLRALESTKSIHFKVEGRRITVMD